MIGIVIKTKWQACYFIGMFGINQILKRINDLLNLSTTFRNKARSSANIHENPLANSLANQPDLHILTTDVAQLSRNVRTTLSLLVALKATYFL